MIEIALCLAIIGFALVSILLVLPSGMNTQRDTREETIINSDASMLLEAIRGGARGIDDLTNSVYAITNYWENLTTHRTGQNGYTYTSASVTAPIYPAGPYSAAPLTNGANIIGLLSTPEFVADLHIPAYQDSPLYTNYPAVPDPYFAYYRYNNGAGCYSNHVVAYVRSISGLAAEKPPQNNAIMQENTFTYRVLCVNAPVPVTGADLQQQDTNIYLLPEAQRSYAENLSGNLHELRLLFMWPQLFNGNVGGFRQNFRATIAGQLSLTNLSANPNLWFYFYNSQSFVTNAP